MYNFLRKLIHIIIPRVRDFKGLNVDSFDGSGNFHFGLEEQLVFPEITYTEDLKLRGVNISIVTTAKTDEEGRTLLQKLGMPFEKQLD
jgi:large subunit ribosomal protein L5